MKAYSIFDDFGEAAVRILQNAGIDIDLNPPGKPRPDHDHMKEILEEYDCVIIGTGQKITADMLEKIESEKIIATASVGVDHIQVPENKVKFIRVINTPMANARSVAEYTLACALQSTKRLSEGQEIYRAGQDNKHLSSKPEDLAGKALGVIGAGAISREIMKYGAMLGMEVIYWTAHPETHDIPFRYYPIAEVAARADVISVNLPQKEETRGIISEDLIRKMKKTCIFISISRLQVVDFEALIRRAQEEHNYYVHLDVDLDEDLVRLTAGKKNVYVTPHIAGGTVQTRQRMFMEIAEELSKLEAEE